jgi:hypothetical protein
MIQEMREMAESFGTGKDKNFSLIDKKKLAKDAKSMGKGVRFLKVKPLKEKEREGYIAYYSFDNINTLKVDQNPSGKTPLPQEGEGETEKEPMTFSFKSGRPATLIIKQPEQKFGPDSSSSGSNEATEESQDTSGFELMMQLMKGFRISFTVEPNGTIVETNATHVDGSRIILVDVDFEELVRNRDQFRELSAKRPNSMEETKKLLKNVKGIKIETAEETTVKFQ